MIEGVSGYFVGHSTERAWEGAEVMTKTVEGNFRSLVDLLEHRAERQGDREAFALLDQAGECAQSLTFRKLADWAKRVSATLRLTTAPGDRALLAFPPGLDFMAAFFGCLCAGVVPVPIMPPKRNRLRNSSLSIAEDCEAVIGLTVADQADALAREFEHTPTWRAIDWVPVDVLPEQGGEENAAFKPSRETLAFLQYTSGSTSSPKGVMVTHGNLLANLDMIKKTLGNDERSNYVSWVPLYHDMGLILNALQTVFLGSRCVFMSPSAFVQRPLDWLRAIDRFEARVAGAPNFAFDLCVERHSAARMEGVDLSRWELAFNGAEPVRAQTIRRFTDTFAPYGFRPEAIYPCYGMAEATLLLSGGDRHRRPALVTIDRAALRTRQLSPALGDDPSAGIEIVGCGTLLEGSDMRIVDPESRVEKREGEIGEIWARGPHIAKGYWNRPDLTQEVFAAETYPNGDGPFLRTGDLGAFLGGEVFVTGRIKDVIIVRGQNHYPQDIEATASAAHPALRPNCAAAFTVGEAGAEALVLVQEVERTARSRLDVPEISGALRKAVVAEHELHLSTVILIRTGTLPKTSSGKVQRGLTRRQYLDGSLQVLADDGAVAQSTG